MSDAASASSSKRHPQPIFEFAKRKQWADLLITELAEAIVLILGPTAKVWYCGPAVHELLGWRDEELIDSDLADLVNVDDRSAFRRNFHRSVSLRTDLTVYARMRCKARAWTGGSTGENDAKEMLFELRGYPHYIPGRDTCECFFLVAKPFPSRSTAMLNTFLELKMEKVRLQRRLRDLKAAQGQRGVGTLANPYPPSASATSSSSIMSSAFMDASQSMMQASHVHMGPDASSYYSMYQMYDDARPMVTSPATRTSQEALLEDDRAEDGLKKKKVKKSHALEMYVCVDCGRTDSPEWRKGPLGPKTLCNACGLRWAKQSRKTDDIPGGSGSASAGR